MKEYTYRTRRNYIFLMLATLAALVIVTGTLTFFKTGRNSDIHLTILVVTTAAIFGVSLLRIALNLFNKIFHERIIVRISNIEFHHCNKKHARDWSSLEKLFFRNHLARRIEYTMRFRGCDDLTFDTNLDGCHDLVKMIQHYTGRAFVERDR